MVNIYIESYGCSASQNEAEIMAGLLQQAGFEIIKNEGYADLIVVVTCYVKTPTEQRILHRLNEIREKYPDKRLIVAGCMPEGLYYKLLEVVPDASMVSTHHVIDIIPAVSKTLKGKRVEYLGKTEELKLCLPKIRKNPLIGIVPISEGCNSYCSYCCVRFAKGKLFSYPKEKIMKEVSNSVKNGCKEIWITSQDNASYGLEKNGARLPEIIREIAKIPGSFWVRIGMMNPKNVLPILPELISAYKNRRIYKFLHLPVQSGDNEVLKNMNREYKTEDFEKIVKNFRENFRVQLWTDVIVGFPAETEEQFKNTVDLIKRVRPDWVNISKFGARPNTPASKMNQLDKKIVNKRSLILSELVRKISLENNERWVGWKGRVLVSKRGNEQNQWFGRNFAYKPVLVSSKEKILGKMIEVKILEGGLSHLFAEPL